jgi:hypothetical protein
MIAAVSATVSYVGDMLGKKIGKKRISLLGLRPRYTSTVITVFTGIAVALLTLAVAVYSSDSVKMAVFGPNIMARQMTELTNEVRGRQSELDDMTLDLIATENELSSVKHEKEAVEAEVAALKEETESLKDGLAEMKQERVIAFQGEILARTSIEPGENGYPTDEAIEKLIALADQPLTERIRVYMWSSQEGAPSASVIVTDEMRRSVAGKLRSNMGRQALSLAASSNLILGQTLEGVLDVFDSNLIYKEGEELMREPLIGATSREEGIKWLYARLNEVNKQAVSKGILKDPFSGNVGALDGPDFYDMVDKIVALGENADGIVVTITAAEDIYTEGPVKVKIEIEPDDDAQRGE